MSRSAGAQLPVAAASPASASLNEGTPPSHLQTPGGNTPTAQLGPPGGAYQPVSATTSQARSMPRDLLTGSPGNYARQSTPEQQVLLHPLSNVHQHEYLDWRQCITQLELAR